MVMLLKGKLIIIPLKTKRVLKMMNSLEDPSESV